MRLALCIAISLSLRAQQFTTTWSRGKCVDCKVAADLSSAQWVSHDEGWGIGFSFPPPGAQGPVITSSSTPSMGEEAGENSPTRGNMRRRRPSGFSTQPTGGSPAGTPIAHKKLRASKYVEPATAANIGKLSPGRRPFSRWSFPMNGTDSQAFGVDDTGDMVRTSDGGATWSKIQIPQLKKITATTVLSGQIAWIADLEGVDLLLFRTVDGGHAWDESRTALPSGWTNLRETRFIDSLHGWIVLTHSGGTGEIRLLATNDGGHTWQPVPLPPSRNNDWWSPVVQFVSDQVGFIFLAEDGQHSVLFTADGGAHWRKYPLPYSISSCQALHGDLICTADRKYSHFGILTLHPK